MDSKRKADVDSDAGAAKRRRTSTYDLTRGESVDSTTAYGMAFVEQLRKAVDKSGRPIATHFLELLPREGNSAYYKRTRMPISLATIEEKLNNGDFKNLAELESYFKRMIVNAKDFYPRSSSVYDDAERIRKTLSNYMTKNNPAYQTRGYQAQPTPLPQIEVAEEEEEEDEEEEEEEEEEPRRRSIVVKRRGPGRPRKSEAPPEPDHEYAGVGYKNLSFQQAQEKVVEELLRHEEPEYDGPYFEPFIDLPPKSLKDYYRIISDPLSLRSLQQLVQGTTELKSWAAFEEKAQLLWNNAYFYNEEGSEIYELAEELEKVFRTQFKKASAVVPDPSAARIKLKVGGSDAPSRRVSLRNGGEDTQSPAVEGDDEDGDEEDETKAETANATPAAEPVPQAPVPPPAPKVQLEHRRQRQDGKGLTDALMTRMHLRAHSSIHPAEPILGSVEPDPKYMQQSTTVNLPAHVNRIFIAPGIPDKLMDRHFSLWVLIDKQLLKQAPHAFPDHTQQDRVFEVMLRPGVNVIEAHLIAAIPAVERVEGGPEAELEVFTAYVNVAKA